MKKDIWGQMSDEQKTEYMRNVFKEMRIGQDFDYAECRRVYERMKGESSRAYGEFDNPCLVLELADPIMSYMIMGWMYSTFNIRGERVAFNQGGDTAPLFGYNLVELHFDKRSLMNFSDDEKSIIKRAVDIINERVANCNNPASHD